MSTTCARKSKTKIVEELERTEVFYYCAQKASVLRGLIPVQLC